MENYYEIIYMKADFEPWWQFEGWEENIVEKTVYATKEDFEEALQHKLSIMRQRYPNERQKNDYYYAFWDENELEYCEGCDDDAQIFHGLITKIPSSL